MTEYVQISTDRDIEIFLERTNHLHDGYVISTSYKNNGIEMIDGGYDFYFDKSRLILQILITSLKDAIVEMVFDSVYEWQLCGGELPILDSYMHFDTNGSIIFTDEEDDGFEYLGSIRIVAGRMSWCIIEF